MTVSKVVLRERKRMNDDLDIAVAVDSAAAENVEYAVCLQRAAQLWATPEFASVPMNEDAAVAIARILYRVANDGQEPPQILADLDDETRACLEV